MADRHCYSGISAGINRVQNWILAVCKHPCQQLVRTCDILFVRSGTMAKAVPTHQDVELLGELSPEQILEKYGVDLTIFRSWIVETCGNAEEHFGQPIVDLDLSVSDGKDNVMIDGASRSRHSVETLKGAWHYPIFAGQTLTCDFRVDQPPQSLQL